MVAAGEGAMVASTGAAGDIPGATAGETPGAAGICPAGATGGAVAAGAPGGGAGGGAVGAWPNALNANRTEQMVAVSSVFIIAAEFPLPARFQ